MKSNDILEDLLNIGFNPTIFEWETKIPEKETKERIENLAISYRAKSGERISRMIFQKESTIIEFNKYFEIRVNGILFDANFILQKNYLIEFISILEEKIKSRNLLLTYTDFKKIENDLKISKDPSRNTAYLFLHFLSLLELELPNREKNLGQINLKKVQKNMEKRLIEYKKIKESEKSIH